MNIQVKKLSKNERPDRCIISRKLFDSLGISREVLYKLHFGQRNCYSYIDYIEGEEDFLYFSRPIFKKLL